MISKKQMGSLKYLIIQSSDASDIAKKILFFLLDKSDFLKKAVCTTITETRNGFLRDDAIEVYNGVHDMKSGQALTHLNEIMTATGSDFLFYVHSGAYQIDGEFKEYERILSYTVWLSDIRFDNKAERIGCQKDNILKIELLSDLYRTIQQHF